MRLGTRGSQLALWQAREVARCILAAGGPACDIVIVRTSGDQNVVPPAPASPQPAAGANVKRLFVKELEDALLDGRIDIAVHSSKDLPAELPRGLVIAATLPRADPRDALVVRHPMADPQGDIIAALGPSPRVGTSSIRRIAQLRASFQDPSFVPLRGNVDTRLRKLDAGECDALALAVAGLQRLGHAHRISHILSVDQCTPAPGQGIIAVECIGDRAALVATLSPISDAASADALAAEQAVVRGLGGNCQMPIGALAEVDGDDLRIRAVVFAPDGSASVRCEVRGERGGAVAIGDAAARALLADGAGALLDGRMGGR
jgi:hydroxymethylbilane synthase